MKKEKAKGGYVPFGAGISIYNKGIKSLGLFFFLIGAVFIICSFFQIPITGYTISPGLTGAVSFAGILLEVIGVILMVVGIKEKGHRILSRTGFDNT